VQAAYVLAADVFGFPIKMRIAQKQLENVDYFNYVGSVITHDGKMYT
jgi:hypothetical protein